MHMGWSHQFVVGLPRQLLTLADSFWTSSLDRFKGGRHQPRDLSPLMAFISTRRGTRPTHVPCLALSNILQISSLGKKTCINFNLTRQTHPPACIQFVPAVNYTGHVWNYVLACQLTCTGYVQNMCLSRFFTGWFLMTSPVCSPLQAVFPQCACHKSGHVLFSLPVC